MQDHVCYRLGPLGAEIDHTELYLMSTAMTPERAKMLGIAFTGFEQHFACAGHT
jgi:hypothetical protein